MTVRGKGQRLRAVTAKKAATAPARAAISYTVHLSARPDVTHVTVIELPPEGALGLACVHGRPDPTVCPHCMGLAFLQ